MKKKLVDIRCATCGRSWGFGEKVSLPEGYSLECDTCRAGTPGKPRKTVRHCSMCRKDVVVFGVSGAVRLVCGECAKSDKKWAAGEQLAMERDKARSRMNEMIRRAEILEKDRDELQREMQERVRIATTEIVEANKLLQQRVKDQEEETLAVRIAAAKRRQYGPDEREVVVDFLKWCADKGYRTWEEIGELVKYLDPYLES